MSGSFIIGIGGGSGSGKSTFSQRLMERYPGQVTTVSCDNYYLRHDDMTLTERSRLNYDAPEALEFDLMIEHMRALKRGMGIDCRCTTSRCTTAAARFGASIPGRLS